RTQPGVVEVSAGAEITNVDIVVARPSPGRSKTYVASGRVIDDAGRPLSNMSFSCEQDLASLQDRASLNDRIHEYGKTDAKGNFTIRDLPPGRYSISLSTSAESPWYSDHSGFEISNQDVEGLEIAARSAGSISGVAVLEGASYPSVIARFSQLRISEGLGFLSGTGAAIGKDGAFKITGIAAPGRLPSLPAPARSRIFIGLDGESLREGFEIIRVERDGIEQEYRFVEVGPGENVSGVKVVVACYRGSVRGQITIE